VRCLFDRLAATTLVAVLAGPSVAPCRSGLAGPRDASTTPDAGMNAPYGPAVSAAVPIAPAAVAAPLSASARDAVAFDPRAGGRPPDHVLRPPIVVVRSAPSILRI
jgi:hypothetical protein